MRFWLAVVRSIIASSSSRRGLISNNYFYSFTSICTISCSCSSSMVLSNSCMSSPSSSRSSAERLLGYLAISSWDLCFDYEAVSLVGVACELLGLVICDFLYFLGRRCALFYIVRPWSGCPDWLACLLEDSRSSLGSELSTWALVRFSSRDRPFEREDLVRIGSWGSGVLSSEFCMGRTSSIFI